MATASFYGENKVNDDVYGVKLVCSSVPNAANNSSEVTVKIPCILTGKTIPQLQILYRSIPFALQLFNLVHHRIACGVYTCVILFFQLIEFHLQPVALALDMLQFCRE